MNCALRCMIVLSALGLVLCVPGCGKEEKRSAKKETSSAPAKVKKSVSAPAGKSEKKNLDVEEGSLSFKIPVQEQKRESPEVKILGKNLEVVDIKDVSNEDKKRENKRVEEAKRSLRTDRPKDSLAEKLSVLNAGKLLRWSPQRVQHGGGAGGVRLPAAVLSPDQSVIAFVETLGESGGPCLSRIIFMDTHTWTLLSVIHIQRADIRNLVFSKDQICALTAAQERVEIPPELLLIEPVTGKVLQRKNAADCVGIYADPDGRIFMIFPGKGIVFPPGDLDGKPLLFSSENQKFVLSFSPNGQFFCAAGTKAELFKCSDLKRQASYDLPEGFRSASAVLLDDQTMFLAPDRLCNQSSLCISPDGAIRNFGTASLGYVIRCSGKEPRQVAACMQKNGEIRKFTGVSLEPSAPIYSIAIKPATRGVPSAVFLPEHLNGIAVLDESGNFFLLYTVKGSGRWRKEILFAPVKE